ncbi:MAG: hypothetical protein IJ619_08400 [Eubacterium sp.]|nr:hypothetical protein [Eubacterium sp.]
MKYISSDTNIWLDFYVIDRLNLPFKLEFVYLMHYETVDKEVISPPELCDLLLEYGLQKTEMSFDKYYYVPMLESKYPKLSKYDRIALSIAKHRKIPLLTGDKPLRSAAQKEGVNVLGSIGLVDEMIKNNIISEEEGLKCFRGFLEHKERRLPEDELKQRIKMLEAKGRG